MISTYTPLNSTLRLSQGEVGYSYGNLEEDPGTATPIDQETQGKLAARMFLSALVSDVRPSIWCKVHCWRRPRILC